VVNNIDDPVTLYKNKSNDSNARRYIDITLKGSATNINAIGAKVIVFTNREIRTYENYPVGDFSPACRRRCILDWIKQNLILLCWYGPTTIFSILN
jgi:hypothetical protein